MDNSFKIRKAMKIKELVFKAIGCEIKACAIGGLAAIPFLMSAQAFRAKIKVISGESE